MAYKVIILYQLYMPSYFLGTFTEYPLYIGDSGVDMQTARRSGITSIGVSWGFRPRQELTENGACHIVDRPEEIIRYL